MRICHVAPHLPPDQAANALLPFHLGQWSGSFGSEVAYISHPPKRDAHRHAVRPDLPGGVIWIPRHRARSAVARGLKLDTARGFVTTAKAAKPLISSCDVVHLHGNGFLVETCAWLAARYRKPTVLTLYGTEIWHYRRRRVADLFTRAYRRAAHVTFYSQGLMNHA